MRATTSSAPPGANGITMVIGFAGQSCAAAGKAASTSAVAIIVPMRRMGSSLMKQPSRATLARSSPSGQRTLRQIYDIRAFMRS
jgi:hypothetical protein